MKITSFSFRSFVVLFFVSIFLILSFSVPEISFAQTGGTDPSILQNSDQNTAIEEAIGGCGWRNPSLCFIWILYYIILTPSFWIVAKCAMLLDFFIAYSLTSESYQSIFIEKGWSLIRDIANVFFIFTLLYLAIRHILGNSAKKAIPTLIIVALLLNFSMFFTRVVIDAGNILARAFYKSIVVDNTNSTDPNYKEISVAMMKKINPQYLLSEALFTNNPSTTGDFSTSLNTNTQYGNYAGASLEKDISQNMGYYALIFALLTAVNLIIAWAFLSVSLLFVGRTIGLWFAMIFSPIALLTVAVPGSGGLIKQMSFDSWKDNLLKLSFMAPIFIFFLYLTIMFVDIFFNSGPALSGEGSLVNLMKIIIPFVFIIMMINIAKKVATEMAGEMGGMVKSVVGKIAGVTAGLALGVTAFAGRKVIGGIASSTLRGGNYNKRIAEKRRALRDPNLAVQDRVKLKAQLEALKATKSSLSKLKQSSFDIRNAGKAKGLVGATARGVGFGLGAGMTAFGGKGFNAGKGSDQSRAKYEDEQKKKALKMAEDQSSVSYRERDAVVRNQRQMVQQEIDEIKAGRVTLEKGFDDQTNEIVKKLDELKAKPPGDLTDEDFKNYDELTDRMENLKNGKIEALKKFDEINNAKIKEKEKIIKDDSKLIDKEVNERRGLAADSVEGRDIWGMYHGVDNKEIADDIRKGKSSKSDEEKALELIEKLQKKKDGEKSKPESKDDGDEKKS